MAEKCVLIHKEDQTIYLTYSKELFSEKPDHVLVIAVYQGKLLFTRHGERGWELPGGKIEPGETPEEASVRETWEETGATIEGPIQMAEYRVETKDQASFTKGVYIARVTALGPHPKGYETEESDLFAPDIDPYRSDFSPYMKDKVFTSIQQKLITGILPPT